MIVMDVNQAIAHKELVDTFIVISLMGGVIGGFLSFTLGEIISFIRCYVDQRRESKEDK